LPAANLPDLEEIDPVVKANLEFIPAEHIETVLKTALVEG
ncbi:MAG: hypothetical protein IIV79_02295, partial [Clostridia bacterium]|nr:hypothetical protein [Clostridia bacterium]